MKLSVYLTEKGYFVSRSQAHLAIKEGKVHVNGRLITKDGFEVRESDEITVDKPSSTYVSRGGFKLEAALKAFSISLQDKTVLDIGASTGGFTDCCLQNGARHVYAYDVGHEQLAEKLRNDPRVTSKEGINCRQLRRKDIDDDIDFICMDVSFISCTLLLEAISDILVSGGQCVILFKPQFEVGAENLNRKGIVNNESAVSERLQYCKKCAEALKLKYKDQLVSPIKGQDGNTEYLLWFCKEENQI